MRATAVSESPRCLCFSIFVAVIAGHCQVPLFDLPIFNIEAR